MGAGKNEMDDFETKHCDACDSYNKSLKSTRNLWTYNTEPEVTDNVSSFADFRSMPSEIIAFQPASDE